MSIFPPTVVNKTQAIYKVKLSFAKHQSPRVKVFNAKDFCIRGNVTDVQQLLERKANVNSRQGLPLQIAAASGSCNLVSLLLAYKADIH